MVNKMAKRNNLYKEFPNRVFGLKCSQHRTKGMREILSQYNGKLGANASKIRLLKLLVRREAMIPDGEVAAITL
jgi:hypothetical protein